MKELKLWQFSSLEKVFLKKLPAQEEIESMSALKGDEISYQIAYTLSETSNEFFDITVDSEIKEYVTVRLVGNVPSELPAYEHDYDDDYITIEPGMFPDVLYPIENNSIEAKFSRYHSLWISINIPKECTAGDYDIKITFENKAFNIKKSKTMKIHIVDAVLPNQEILYTQWIHPNAMADYYGIKMFSEKYWDMLEKFIKCAKDNGVNMIFIPLFSDSVDEDKQPCKIYREKDKFSFDFSRIERYIKMCLAHGINNFEMAHFFAIRERTSVGITCEENGKLKPLFDEGEYSLAKYTEFLKPFLTALAECLKRLGVYEKTSFHIGDEPTLNELDLYGEISGIFKEILGDINIIDALSDYEFYEKGYLNVPVVAIDHMKPYIGKKGIFGYNCCAQHTAVSNRFMAMPSYRNRIIGVQIYKYNLTGFLHWGFDCYYTEKNPHILNPFLSTDGDSTWQSGDPFSVYPGKDGPIESIRLKVFKEALSDIRALSLLESFVGKEQVTKLINDLADEEITFENYPRTATYLLSLRNKVNKLIEENSR